MSNRLTIAREALRDLLRASRTGVSTSQRQQAERALEITGFASPPAFPCLVETRSGGRATLVARFGNTLVGLIHAGDDGDKPATWNDDGTWFSLDDKHEHDLVMPEAAPLGSIIA